MDIRFFEVNGSIQYESKHRPRSSFLAAATCLNKMQFPFGTFSLQGLHVRPFESMRFKGNSPNELCYGIKEEEEEGLQHLHLLQELLAAAKLQPFISVFVQGIKERGFKKEECSFLSFISDNDLVCQQCHQYQRMSSKVHYFSISLPFRHPKYDFNCKK